MQTTMIDIINNYGYLGVFLLILLENLFPPIPSEVVLLFGGAMTMAGASTSNNSPLGHLTYSLTMEDGQGTYSN